MKLKNFKKLKKPLPAKDIKKITGSNWRFRSTMFKIDKEASKELMECIEKSLLRNSIKKNDEIISSLKYTR